MKVKFNRIIALDGHDHRPGVHEIPDHLAGHWYLLASITNGHAQIVEAPKKVPAVVLPVLKAEPIALAETIALAVVKQEVAPVVAQKKGKKSKKG